MARPPIPVDEDQVLKLATLHCTNKEIAAFFEISVDTLTRRFADILNKGRETGRMALRRMQWKYADKGNVVMLIWLGKQYLEQSDKLESKTEVKNDSKQIFKVQWLDESDGTNPTNGTPDPTPKED